MGHYRFRVAGNLEPEIGEDGRPVFTFADDCRCTACVTMRAQHASYVAHTFAVLGHHLKATIDADAAAASIGEAIVARARLQELRKGTVEALANWPPNPECPQ